MPRMAEKRSAGASRSFLGLSSSSPRPAASRRAAQGVAFLVGLDEFRAQVFAAYGAVGAHVDELEAAALQLLKPRGELAGFPVSRYSPRKRDLGPSTDSGLDRAHHGHPGARTNIAKDYLFRRSRTRRVLSVNRVEDCRVNWGRVQRVLRV
jgi:hypothetical protein